MKVLGSVEAVIAAVRDDVAVDLEALEHQGERQLAAEREQAGGEPATAPDRDRRLASARREARERLAQEDWEDARAALEHRERWIADVLARARARLLSPEPGAVRRRRLADLAHEAIAALPGDEARLAVTAGDRPLLDEAWCLDVAARAGKRQIAIETEDIGGGCRARSSDGRLLYDNSIDARVRRLEVAWRAVLGQLYHEAIGAVEVSPA